MGEMFGTDGVVNATDDVTFETLCDDVTDCSANFSVKFEDYFTKRLRPALKVKVNLPMREGVISSKWTNNNSVHYSCPQTNG